MEVSVYKIRLKSKNIAQSISFYSFLFDTDVEEGVDGESFIHIGSTRLYFDEDIKKSLHRSVFTIGINNSDNFADFKNKVNLAFYKDNLTLCIVEDTETAFSFKDMDDNPWRFELM
jgi:hypothetical protein